MVKFGDAVFIHWENYRKKFSKFIAQCFIGYNVFFNL